MAIQDSGFIGANGSLAILVNTNMYINASFEILAEGDMNVVNAGTVSDTFTSMRAEGYMNVSSVVDISSGSISISGSLNSVIENQVLVNAYSVLYGFLSSIVRTYSSVFCADITVDFSEQIIESTGCTIGDESMALTRYRGDTYPVSTKLIKNGSSDVAGSTFKMSTQISGGVIYTADGIIENASLGIVNFPLDILAIGTSGEGVYDIQGNDGTYLYTYEKGVFTLLDDVTV